MAYESGGLADKLGNRFEKRWVIRQLLQLIAGRIRALQYEPAGRDGAGVDLWIEQFDAGRQAQQCKGENGTKAEWSMADLHEVGVLGYLAAQLVQDPSYEFALVSATPAGIFRDLCRSARDSENAGSFWENQVKDRSKKHHDGFVRFCKYLKINHETSAGLEHAHDLLRRSHYHPFSDDNETMRQLELFAGLLAVGEPAEIIVELSSFAETEGNFRRWIYSEEVIEYLRKKGHSPRELSRDARLPQLIEGMRRIFAESLGHQLAAGRLIPRAETRIIVEWIGAPGQEQILVLHGPAGAGKSGVLYELALQLAERGIPFLPLRLDRQPPAGNARRYGEERGLPDSPALCLHAVAGERPAVLILDQLDALRWTSAHSSEAFPICQETIRQAMDLGRNRLVVVTCRTFDLENDPQIRVWKDRIISRKVRVEPLPDAVIREFVESLHVPYNSLRGREKQLLANVQNLTMWTEIVASSGRHAGFATATDLSRQFWQSRWRELGKRGVPRDDVAGLLEAVTGYMEQNGRLDAPERLIARYAVAAAELQSLNVIQVAGQRVTFCHQNYLDYHVSERLLERIDKGADTVITWLGGRERQSLFRREQLRLVLNRLRDEEPGRFLQTMRELLVSDAVRFHLKQMAIQCLGQIDNPSTEEVDLALELFRQPDWRGHIADSLVFNNPAWFGLFDDRGEWRAILATGDSTRAALPLSLMRSVSEQCGDRVARLLAPCLERGGDGPYWCAYVIPFDATKDSDELFELRLRLPFPANGHDMLFLPALARQRPDRCIRLLANHLSRRLSTGADGANTGNDRAWDNGIDRYEAKDILAFRHAGSAQPRLAWDILWPVVVQFEQATLSTHGRFLGHEGIPDPLAEILTAAGRRLLRMDSADFFRRIYPLDDGMPKSVLSTVLAALFRAPTRVGDQAVQWIMSRPASLRSGSRADVSEWEPVRRVIHRHARRCTEETYRQLESFLMRYHDEDERRSFRRRRERARENWHGLPNLYGQTQYHLLPALPKSRKSREATDLQGVLQRKYDAHKADLFTLPRSHFGYVTSAIDEASERSMPDGAWLAIIMRGERGRAGPTLRCRAGGWAASSPEHLAQSLAQSTLREPDRFARLLLRLPPGANGTYYGAILDSLAFKNPPQNLSEQDKAQRHLPGLDLLEPVVIRTLDRGESDHLRSLCRMLREFSDLEWPIGVIERVVAMAARQQDPPPLIIPHGSAAQQEGTVQFLEIQSINRIRSEAAWTIKDLLWADIDRWAALRALAEALLSDGDAAVRAAAVSICGPVWNVERDWAARWFCRACDHADERIAASRDARRLLPFIQRSHPDALRPVVLRMVRSELPDVAEVGASHATANWIMHGSFDDEFRVCRTGNAGQRRGVALAAAELSLNEDYTQRSIEILRPLLNDEDDSVRTRCERLFYNGNPLVRPDMIPYLEAYVCSLAFRRNQWAIMRAVKDFPGSLVPSADLLMNIIEVCAGPLADASRDYSTRTAHEVSDIGAILLRLYEQAESRNDIQQRCLDAWDLLLRQRVGNARQITDSISL